MKRHQDREIFRKPDQKTGKRYRKKIRSNPPTIVGRMFFLTPTVTPLPMARRNHQEKAGFL
jgi:hypothetical protein